MNLPSPLILVFDRDASVRAWYRAAFESSDYVVAEAADGPEAAARLTRELPDLVITELRTGHFDGLALCLLKRSNASTADIPILISIVEDDSDMEAAAKFAGAAAILKKPTSPESLVPRVVQLILATSRKMFIRRQLYRILVHLRQDAENEDPPRAALDGGGAHELLTPVESAGSSVMLTNDAARGVAANAAACQLTGYSEAELLDRSVWDLTPGDTLASARMLWGRFLVNGECAGRFLMVRKDGTEVPIQLCAVANIAPGIHAVAVGRESITESG